MHSVSSAARLCGVSPSTLRAWERRYGVVEPIRTDGGYRVYDDEALQRLTRMSSLIASGWSPRHAAAYVIGESGNGEPGPLPGGPAEEVRPDPVPPTPEEEAQHIEVILQAAEVLDGPRIADELDFVFSIHSFDDLVDIWLRPALKSTLEAGRSGRLTDAGEHFLNAGIERRMQACFEEARQHEKPSRPTVIIGVPGPVRNTIEVYARATSLRRNGCHVTYLGTEVPVQDWLSAIDSTGADMSCIHIETRQDAAAAATIITELGTAHPNARVYVGGPHAADVTTGDRVIHIEEASITTCVERMIADHLEATAGLEPQPA